MSVHPNSKVSKFLCYAYGRFKRSVYLQILLVISVALSAFHLPPLPAGLEHKDFATLLVDKNGQLLSASIAKDEQWRFPPMPHIPAKYETALLLFEDQYFYQHPGINIVSLSRAFLHNLQNTGQRQGGSTITMQLARMLRGNPRRSYTNKIIEMFIALKLEWHLSKQEILLHYANRAPFGGNTVGLSAAQWRYFHKQVADSGPLTIQNNPLSWAEAALLAVLPNSPALIHPGRHRNKLKRKRDRLLQELFEKKHFDASTYRLALLEPIPKNAQALPQYASHMLFTKKQLQSPSKGQNILHTHIDATLQAKVRDKTARHHRAISELGINNIAAIVLNNRSMQVEAYLGNFGPQQGIHAHAKHVDIARRPRSSGSILKPMLYAAMLDAGLLLPNTLVPDVPIRFQGFSPENFDGTYRGAVPAASALAQSLNIPAVYMLQRYGVPRFYQDLKALGMTTLTRNADDYGLSLILGGAETTLYEIVHIYAKIVRQARQASDRELAHMNTAAKAHDFPLSPGASWLTLEALQKVSRPGLDRRWMRFANSQKISWKTGTSYGLRDAWSVGSNGQYTVAIWAGNADGTGVANLSGTQSAAPLMFSIFETLGTSQWFKKPHGELKVVQACVNDGFLPSGACQTQPVEAPRNSHFQQVSPHHKRIHLDANSGLRVHGACESVARMREKIVFRLPPRQHHFWQNDNMHYDSLPDWRDDCKTLATSFSRDVSIDLVYPSTNTRIYIPKELNGQQGRVILRAAHSHPDTELFWHLNRRFINSTTLDHRLAVNLAPGWHTLVIMDENGNRLKRRFEVLGKEWHF